MGDFSEDLEVGHKSEKIILQIIQKKYPQAYMVEGYFKEYDIWIPEIHKGVEVKQDYKSEHTGNIVVEIEMYDKPSALMATGAYMCGS